MRCLERLELQGWLPAEQGGCQRSGVAAAARARRRCELAAVLTIVTGGTRRVGSSRIEP